MKLYKYIYYRLYQLIDKDYEWATDLRASILINLFEIGFIMFIVFKFLGGRLDSTTFLLVMLFSTLPLVALNIYLFIFKDSKSLIIHFKNLKKSDKRNLNIQMYSVLIILIGLVYFLYKL